MEVISLTQARHFLREKPIHVNVIDRPRLSAELVCLEPEQQDQRQSHDLSDQLYLVVEGRCRIVTPGAGHDLGPQDALVVPPGVEHKLENPGPERLTLLAFLAPKPARASEVRMPRQPRTFERPRPAFQDAGQERPLQDEGHFGQRRFEGRGDTGTRRPPATPRREFTGGRPARPPRREFDGPPGARPPARAPYGRRDEFNGPPGSRPPARAPYRRGDAFDGPPGARPPARAPFGRRDESDGPTGSRPPARAPYRRPGESDAPPGGRPPARAPYARPGYPPARGRTAGGRPAFGQAPRPSGPRPFGSDTRPPRSRPEGESAAGGDERHRRRPPVPRDFYPKEKRGGGRPFGSVDGAKSSSPGSRGRPPATGTGRGSSGGAGGSSRPPAGRSGRPAPGRSGPRTSGRRPAP